MKSLIIALSLLLAYAPVVSAEENSGDDFGVETGAERLVNNVSDLADDAARSAKDSVGEIVILEGAGNVAIAKYIPNPKEEVEEDNEYVGENAANETDNLPNDKEENAEENTPDVPVKIQSETEVITPTEGVQNSDTSDADVVVIEETESADETAQSDANAEASVPDDATDVVIIEETESADETAQSDANAEADAPQDNISVEEVVIETEPETEVSEDKETSNTTQEENAKPAEIEEVAVVVEEEPEGDDKTKEEYDEEISYYIKNMNLSVEQLDMAKYISSDSRLKMDQLLKSIYLLRAQARELEAKSLNDFETILTEEQKEQFHKLRAAQEKSRKKFEVFDVKAMEGNSAENQPQDATENGENKPVE